MIKLHIDKTKTFLPLGLSKGTVQERLQNATAMNLAFYKNLQDEFVNREVRPAVFKRVLQKSTGAKIGIDIIQPLDYNTTKLGLNLRNGKIKGYVLSLPCNILNGNVLQRYQRVFLLETQKFFNEICNPKFLTRKISVFNKISSAGEVNDFYMKNIQGKNILSENDLNKLLKTLRANDKINTLQLFRYTLQSEKNTRQAERLLDKSIEKAENLKLIGKNYDLTDYKYDEKLTLLNSKLLKVLQDERKNPLL